MRLIWRLRASFIPDDTILTREDCVIIIRARGYYLDSPYNFSRGWGGDMTQISVYEDKVYIKAYSGGYGESDTIRFPITKKQLIRFIRANAV